MTASPTPPPSGNTWKWVAFGCGGVALVMIGAIAALAFFAQRYLTLAVDPESAATKASEMMDYEIPGGAVGVVAIGLGPMQMAGVASAQKPADTSLFVGKMAGYAGQVDINEMQRSFEGEAEVPGTTFRVTAQQEESRQLCGQAVTVLVADGEQTDTNAAPGETVRAAVNMQTVVEYEADVFFVSLTTAGDGARDRANQVFDSLNCR
ncbi:hypothetical protein ACQ4M4_01605 [Leptolyngbya sp. AN02str]|uniref:hypothetical protein n=1 Tax=Leptolyngbya sp. AN02str TaxID=3423363 RepID=UPI003D319938